MYDQELLKKKIEYHYDNSHERNGFDLRMSHCYQHLTEPSFARYGPIAL
jgi:hypothetical protein